ncbi:MAG: LruC domain-containing protein [SAR324 cluster bacterium]|nr:LruC domain-containing protein [SAR324 cluster bacterium]
MDVPDSLNGNITEAVLDVVLLDTNVSLGDPEAFYDYSNGFEDLAIFNKEDSDYLNVIAPGREEAPDVTLTNPVDTTVANWYYYPSSSTYYMAAYEDLFPAKGDYDFNDLVVAYQVTVMSNASSEVVGIEGIEYLLARGAAYNHDWHLKINVPGGSGSFTANIFYSNGTSEVLYSDQFFSDVLDLNLFQNTKILFPPNFSEYTNTPQEAGFGLSPKVTYSISFTQPTPLSSIEEAPFDPYLFVKNGITRCSSFLALQK